MTETVLPPVAPDAPKGLDWIRAGRRLLTFLLYTGLVLWGLAFLFLPASASWREKVTLTIQTPTGVVSASGVRGYTLTEKISLGIPEAKGIETKMTGEAVPLEVAPGKWVFVLLSGSRHHSFVKPDWDKNGGVDGHVRLLKATIGDPPLELGPRGLSLGTFLDIDVPDSFRFVKGNDLEAIFGAGYSVVSTTVEITREPVTEEKTIEVLDWWMNYRAGPYNNMMYLKVPDESPVGHTNVPARRFWSVDVLRKMDKKWENTNGVN